MCAHDPRLPAESEGPCMGGLPSNLRSPAFTILHIDISISIINISIINISIILDLKSIFISIIINIYN